MMGNDGSPARPLGDPIGTSRDPIHHAVEMIVKDFREAGITDGGLIRAEVLGAAKEALDTGGSIVLAADADDQGATLADAASVFRLIFRAIGADDRDQRVQETLFGRIEHALAEILTDP